MKSIIRARDKGIKHDPPDARREIVELKKKCKAKLHGTKMNGQYLENLALKINVKVQVTPVNGLLVLLLYFISF